MDIYPHGTTLNDKYEVHDLDPDRSIKGLVDVYTGRQLSVRRSVLLRAVSLSVSPRKKEELRARFADEARLLQSLRHKCVPRCFDLDQATGDRPFMVMEHREGITLAKELAQNGRLSIERAVALFIPCLEGLSQFHEAGTAHLRLSPQSLFIANPDTPDETLCLENFGTVVGDPEGHTVIEDEASTPHPGYISPELIEGGDVGSASDVYQMGLVLIEMLTGRPAVGTEGKNKYECQDIHLDGELAIPDWLKQSTLGAVLLKATHIKSTERYPDADHFRNALMAVDINDIEVPAAPPRGLEQGARLGSYIVGVPFTEGEQGTLYTATHQAHSGAAAIKVMKVPEEPKLKAAFTARFMREIAIITQLSHPNTVGILDSGTLPEPDERPYMVLDYLEGETLAQCLYREGGLDPVKLLPLICTVLEALEEAHSLGIMHKDLKPSHISMTPQGPVLIDFGVSRVEGEAQLTRWNERVCTPSYSAPEYLEKGVSIAAGDVYSMALVLVEGLTGRIVIPGETVADCFRQHLSGQAWVRVPKSLKEGPLGSLLIKALDVDPDKRYPTASAFAEALSRVDPDSVQIPNEDKLPAWERHRTTTIVEGSDAARAKEAHAKLKLALGNKAPSNTLLILIEQCVQFGPWPPHAHEWTLVRDAWLKVNRYTQGIYERLKPMVRP